MKFVINLLGKWSGFNKAWDMLDGYKTKISGVALLCSGLAGLLFQVGALPHDLAAVWGFIQALPNDPSWLTFMSGLAVLGIGHKIEKGTDGPTSPPMS
ncbi:hypothetical protein CCP3SC1AL1_110029 [Gammaproteobacteria bacterium]